MAYDRNRWRRGKHRAEDIPEPEDQELWLPSPGKITLAAASLRELMGISPAALSPGKITRTHGMVQRKAAPSDTGLGAERSETPNAGLPYAAEMEAAFGQSFADVTVGLGKQREMASLGAQAATQGEHIAFASPAPTKELVAHELAHVVQQRTGRAPVRGPRIDPDPSLEREADQTAAHVARGGVIHAIPALTATPQPAAIFRKPDLNTIDWKGATGGKMLSDHTNNNQVFLVRLPDGDVVVKVYAAGGPSKEVAAARLISGLGVPGVEAPGMRLVIDEDEVKACRSELEKLAPKELVAGSLAVMDAMDGNDFSSSAPKDMLDPGQKSGLERIKNTGSLLAFHHMVKAIDRFAEPSAISGTTGNNSNLRYAQEGTSLQAIDTSLPDSQTIGLEKEGGARDEVIRQKRRVGAHIDEIVLNALGSELVTVLAKQLKLNSDDPTVQKAIREGFLEGVDAIGNADVDFKGLITSIGPPEKLARLLTTPKAASPAYAEYLVGMQAFFREKMGLVRAASDAEGAKEGSVRRKALALVKIANELALGKQPDLTLAKEYEKADEGEHGKWPDELKTLHKYKNELKKKPPIEQLKDMMLAVSPAFTAVMGQNDDKVVTDFCRTAGKVIVRLGNRLAAPPSTVTNPKSEKV